MKLLVAFGTRPEWIKIAPLLREMDRRGMKYKTLFTGQHTDLLKSVDVDYRLSIEDGENRLDSIVKSTMNGFYWGNEITHVLVQGDTTSVLSVALSAFHHGVKVIHLEAGLRTYDRNNPYPEEMNRRIVSQIADIHLCPTQSSAQNLYNEHINIKDVYVVGNTVLDNLLSYKKDSEYTNKILVTMHRRENHHWMGRWFGEINSLAEKYPEYDFILPLHPNPNVQRYKKRLKNVKVVEPMSHEELLKVLIKTRLVITDSGGIQEECSFFNKKCLTCRKVTERPEALNQSTFIVEAPQYLAGIFIQHINNYAIDFNCPFGDGHSAEKIIDIFEKIGLNG